MARTRSPGGGRFAAGERVVEPFSLLVVTGPGTKKVTTPGILADRHDSSGAIPPRNRHAGAGTSPVATG